MKTEEVVAKMLKQECVTVWGVQHGHSWYMSTNKPTPALQHKCRKCTAITVESWQFSSYVQLTGEIVRALGLKAGELNELVLLRKSDAA